jgi:hypothetical protein
MSVSQNTGIAQELMDTLFEEVKISLDNIAVFFSMIGIRMLLLSNAYYSAWRRRGLQSTLSNASGLSKRQIGSVTGQYQPI